MNTSTDTDRWAPWWVYVVVIGGVNYLRQWVVPYGTMPEVVDAVLALVIAGVLFIAITAGYRVAMGGKKGS